MWNSLIIHTSLEIVLRLKKYTMGDFVFFVLYRVWTFHFYQIWNNSTRRFSVTYGGHVTIFYYGWKYFFSKYGHAIYHWKDVVKLIQNRIRTVASKWSAREILRVEICFKETVLIKNIFLMIRCHVMMTSLWHSQV